MSKARANSKPVASTSAQPGLWCHDKRLASRHGTGSGASGYLVHGHDPFFQLPQARSHVRRYSLEHTKKTGNAATDQVCAACIASKECLGDAVGCRKKPAPAISKVEAQRWGVHPGIIPGWRNGNTSPLARLCYCEKGVVRESNSRVSVTSRPC